MNDNASGGLPPLGKTFFEGSAPSVTTQTIRLEGVQKSFQDLSVSTGTGAKVPRSGRFRVARLVRNASGITLQGKRLVSWQSGYRGTRVDGYVRTSNAEAAGVVDDQLPTSGVVNNDLFWLIIKGPCLIKTALEANANNVLVDGDIAVALTAATSQATTSGRFIALASSAATTQSGAALLNAIGRVMTARTTANTNTDTLVDLDLPGT